MICLKEVKKYCQEYKLIKNYQEAVNDNTQTWHCHHRFEIEYKLSKIELQAMGFYFNRPFEELIFLTPEEHMRLHQKGKPKSEEFKQKMSGSRKGNQNSLKYHIPEEELYDLYIVQGLTQKQIAELYGCNPMCIWHKLKKHNIKK